MAVERPTFSESWYRVAHLCPRLRSTVQVHRQHYRGQLWHVLQDPTANQFYRLNEPAYHFVAMLDGRREVAQVWRICNEQLGDAAPTQVEVVEILGQLYVSNLLHAELPPDAQGLFERHRRRIRREVKGYVSQFLWIRIPLLDPDRFLDATLPMVRWLFSWAGFVLWMALLVMGGYFAVTNLGELVKQGQEIFRRTTLLGHLPLLYGTLVVLKACHEFSHAYACKKFGRQAGGPGEVHVMGVMFLVFMPLPYVDASSAWAFRGKRDRIVVSLAGMMVEFALASVAVAVWANTGPGAINSIAYNIIFIASVSSVLFNGNPLLRYDAYYVLSDLLEIPNLASRSRDYIKYLVKRYGWGVRRLRNPGHAAGEKGWLAVYGVASTLYRVFIVTMILLFMTDRLPDALFAIAVVMAVAAGIVILVVPVFKFGHYLFSNNELFRTRGRAISTSLLVIAAALGSLGFIPVGDHCRVDGVVEPVRMAAVFADADGFLADYLPSGRWVEPDGEPLFQCVNRELTAEKQRLQAQLRLLQAKRRAYVIQETAAGQMLDREIAALGERLQYIDKQISSLTRRTSLAGLWIAPNIERLRGVYLQRGAEVGQVADPGELLIRAVADQQLAAMAFEARPKVEIRVKGRPDMELTGRITDILPAGQKHLPSVALGYAVGGSIPTAPDDPKGIKAAEMVREIHIVPDNSAHVRLLSGQRVVIRMNLPDKPLLSQWWRGLRQLLQQRFHT